jgi:threonine synthase
VIESLPKIIGVQSEHADPVYRYYLEEEPEKRVFLPVTVKSSVAQAAMIGNPVSMPRVIALVDEYNRMAGEKKVFVIQVSEQEIMDAMIEANRNGNIACTQGGETFAGLRKAVQSGKVKRGETAVLDSTAHVLKFAGFQEMYFNDAFPADFGVKPRAELRNAPIQVAPKDLARYPEQGKPLTGEAMKTYVLEMATEIARILELKRR